MLVIDGNAGARCGISMKGVDILVKGSIGHMSAFMAQAGTLTVLGDAGEALGDSLYEARLYVRGSVKSLGSDCIEKEMRDEHRKQLFAKLEAGGLAGEIDLSEFKRYGSARRLYHFNVDKRRSLLMAENPMDPRGLPRTHPRFSATYTPDVMAEIRRAAATGIYDIRGAGRSASCRTLTTSYSSAPRSAATPSRVIGERCVTEVVLGGRFASKPITLKTPITIAGMSFGSLSANAKEALGRGATLAGTSTTTGDGGMTEEERGHSKSSSTSTYPLATA